jgi:hypothetical protein
MLSLVLFVSPPMSLFAAPQCLRQLGLPDAQPISFSKSTHRKKDVLTFV